MPLEQAKELLKKWEEYYARLAKEMLERPGPEVVKEGKCICEGGNGHEGCKAA